MKRAMLSMLLTLVTSSGMTWATGCEVSELRTEALASGACPPVQAIDWPKLSRLRIVFGHQSVGENVLTGIERLAARDGGKIDIHERRMTPALPGISHFLIGRNGEPMAKIQDFSAALDAGAVQGADVAMMKLCYVDFDATTDARQVADDYIASLESLAQRHPGTRFVAVTVPLTALQSGAKAWIKRLIGKSPGGYGDNAKRSRFNMLLRERYLAAGRLFDLARVESGTAGERCTVRVDGQEVEVLCPQLTNDGGHLNERGQMLAATALLDFLSALPSKRGTE